MRRHAPGSRHALCPFSAAAACLFASSVAIAQASPEPSALLARVDSLASEEARAGRLSGVILVARGDRLLLQRAYGFASWELRAPNSPATRFAIGSITKAMTETLVGMLVDAGRLELDAPASRYLGSFPVGPNGGVVTVRHLLTHRSGVPHRVTSAMDETLPLHPIDVVARVRTTKLLFEPGSKELYSSAGFTCLARIIELIEGKPFDAVLRERVFLPAAMTAAIDETGEQLMLQRALPHRLAATSGAVVAASTSYKNLGFLTGAGSVYATAEDVLHFIRASRTGVIGREARQRTMDSVDITWRTWYGRIDGHEASVDYQPRQDVTIVFLSNMRSAANWQLREQLRNGFMGRSSAAFIRPPPVAPPFEAPNTFVGAYGDPSDPLVISVVDGHYFRDESEFYPIDGGRYYVPASAFVMRFRRNANGVVDALLTTRPGGNETAMLLVAAPR